jgi:hypothetical protein
MLYHRRGTKSFTGAVEGDSVTFRCSCEVFSGIPVVVRMPRALAEALIARRPAREVLVGFPRAAVELFTSGLTEAEFDLAYRRSARSIEDYELYATKAGCDETADQATLSAGISPPGEAVAASQQQMAFLH